MRKEGRDFIRVDLRVVMFITVSLMAVTTPGEERTGEVGRRFEFASTFEFRGVSFFGFPS